MFSLISNGGETKFVCLQWQTYRWNRHFGLYSDEYGKFVVTVSTGSSRVTALRLFNVGSQDIVVCSIYENLYSPHNSDSSSDKIDTKYTTKILKINLIRT